METLQDRCECSALHINYYPTPRLQLLTGAKVGWFRCSPVDDYAATVLHDNEYFTADGNVSECGVPLQQWQAKGGDQRSTVALLPKDDVIIAWAKVALGSL